MWKRVPFHLAFGARRSRRRISAASCSLDRSARRSSEKYLWIYLARVRSSVWVAALPGRWSAWNAPTTSCTRTTAPPRDCRWSTAAMPLSTPRQHRQTPTIHMSCEDIWNIEHNAACEWCSHELKKRYKTLLNDDDIIMWHDINVNCRLSERTLSKLCWQIIWNYTINLIALILIFSTTHIMFNFFILSSNRNITLYI